MILVVIVLLMRRVFGFGDWLTPELAAKIEEANAKKLRVDPKKRDRNEEKRLIKIKQVEKNEQGLNKTAKTLDTDSLMVKIDKSVKSFMSPKSILSPKKSK